MITIMNKITKEFNVDLIVVHPHFNMPVYYKQKLLKQSTNDIAMVKLAEDVDLSVYTQPRVWDSALE